MIETILTSTDSNYKNFNPDDVPVTNQNVDAPPVGGVAAIIISPNTGLITNETGTGSQPSFNVTLATMPSADVVLDFTSDNTLEGMVTAATKQITLTQSNYNSPGNTVTIQGQQDNNIDGDQKYAINYNITTTDMNYSGLTPIPVGVTNLDSKITDAMISITPSPTGNNQTTRQGGSVTFSVVLTKLPTADVILGFISNNTVEGKVSPAGLTFTNTTWDQTQSFTVTGQASQTAGDQSYTVSIDTKSNDPNYQPVNNGNLPTGIALTNIDAGPPPPAVDYSLYINSGSVTIDPPPNDTVNIAAVEIPVWGYTDTVGGAVGTAQIPGPLLEAVVGDTITVEVFNNHTVPHNFVIAGLTADAAEILPGTSKTYTFTTDQAGVFLYGDSLLTQSKKALNRAMGLFGALVVRPATPKTAWQGGPTFDTEKLWVITDMDTKQWNKNATATTPYKPDYFLINGMNGFKAMEDPATHIAGIINETFIVRIVNAGMYDQSLHFHGNHFKVISQDGIRLPSFIDQDTINVKAGRTAVVLYTIIQPGSYPMHVHTAQMETGDGVYLQGTATMIISPPP